METLKEAKTLLGCFIMKFDFNEYVSKIFPLTRSLDMRRICTHDEISSFVTTRNLAEADKKEKLFFYRPL
ncbi:CLUMA_CG006442, isoform A [Clunio marinus]|uniref:CLUMA_CG006442, isoform A n=1 Tax=Clunio marinus TaxID=568069 RepID=A0A1J1HZW9_9DIPT|nr:CLUMA_CG006442, isoform A [Clunio marinus]